MKSSDSKFSLHTRVVHDHNTLPTGAQLVDELPGLSQLERVCAEIVQTENVYVEDLRQVVEVS